jgi:hypothetical protein
MLPFRPLQPPPTAGNRSRRVAVAVGGGACHAAAVLLWAVTTGVRFEVAGDPLSTAVAVGYAVAGAVLVAAVPLYLLGRASLVSPALVAAWALANTVYLRRYVPRPHDALASYLTVWPLFLGLAVVAAAVEAGVRVGTDRSLGRFGLRPLL